MAFLLNLGITKNCSLKCELQYPVHLATAAFLLIISSLPFSFFVGLYVVTIIIFGETRGGGGGGEATSHTFS